MDYLWEGMDKGGFKVCIVGNNPMTNKESYPLLGLAFISNEPHWAAFNLKGNSHYSPDNYSLIDFPENWEEHVKTVVKSYDKAINECLKIMIFLANKPEKAHVAALCAIKIKNL